MCSLDDGQPYGPDYAQGALGVWDYMEDMKVAQSLRWWLASSCHAAGSGSTFSLFIVKSSLTACYGILMVIAYTLHILSTGFAGRLQQRPGSFWRYQKYRGPSRTLPLSLTCVSIAVIRFKQLGLTPSHIYMTME